jgi:AcrR family transcriptional regulator
MIDAAISIALEGGSDAVTITAIAKRIGISRASIYEYFSSTEDLLTDFIVDEMNIFAKLLENATKNISDPYLQIANWISGSLKYASDGRHMMAKSFSAIATPEFRKEEVELGHRRIMATIIDPLKATRIKNIGSAAAYLQSAVDAASKRIDAGNDQGLEIEQTIKFVVAGLQALEVSA